jgi:hypothetical protein
MRSEVELIKNEGRGSKDAWAVVRNKDLGERSFEVGAFSSLCLVDGEVTRIKISPTSHLYLTNIPPAERLDELLGAVPYAAINGRPRLWTTDFALLHGARTTEQVRNWLGKEGLKSQAKEVGSLLVPAEPLAKSSSVFFDGTDNEVRGYLEGVFGSDAFYLVGDEIVLELPLTDKGKRPRASGETVHVRVTAPGDWRVQSPAGGNWWHVVPTTSEETLCTIKLSSWSTEARTDDDHAITCPWCRARIIAIEIAAPPPSDWGDEGEAPLLHLEIQRILRSENGPMTSRAVADAVNAAGQYRRRDGSPVPASQISARVSRHPELFERTDLGIKLRTDG